MSNTRMTSYLDDHEVKYALSHHTPEFSAQRVAAAAHVSGRTLAKTVMVEIDGQLSMAVIPANTRCRLGELARLAGSRDVALAHEDDFALIFADCDLGAIPPFGNLWGVPVYLSGALAQCDEITFPDGDVHEVVTMNTADFVDLVDPFVLEPSMHT